MKIQTIVALCKNKEGKLIDGCSCGTCRQVISEFSTAETRVIYQFNNKIVIQPFKNLLPDAFTKQSLETGR
jgi:cytidine deaminase